MADYEKTNTLAVDLDGTLAERQSPFNPLSVGEVIKPMLTKVKAQLAKGRKVVLFTARASTMDAKAEKAIKAWLKEHGLEKLEITCTKTPDITEFWDDRARGVKVDEGHFRELVKDAARADRLQRLWARQGRCGKCGGPPEDIEGLFAGGALTCAKCGHSWLIPTTFDDSPAVKQAKEIVRKEVPRTDIVEYCPHCDHQFVEKGGPHLKREEGKAIEDCEWECPHCHGEIWMPLPDDDQIERTGVWLGGSRRGEYIQREKERRDRKRAARETKLKAQEKRASIERPIPQAATESGVRSPANHNSRFLNTLRSRASLKGEPAAVSALPTQVLDKVQPPTDEQVTPAWFKLPAYKGREVFQRELNAAQQYRERNPEVFNGSQMDWFTPVPTEHGTLGGMFGGGGAYQAAMPNSRPSRIVLGEPHLKTLRAMGGPVRILEHEATHAALENGHDPKDVGMFGADLDRKPPSHLLNHHDTLPAEMRAYMSKLQEHQFESTGSRFTTPEQYREYIKGMPFDDEEEFNKHMESLPFDPRRMFQQLRKLRGEDRTTFDKIMDWQARSIPGYVDANSTNNWERKVAALKAPAKFSRPENWDAEEVELDGCKFYAGANDWESGSTWMWVVRKDTPDLHGDLIWVAINNPLGRDDSCSSTEATEAKKKGQAAVAAWLSAARAEARRDLPEGDKSNPQPDYWHFVSALKRAELEQHVWSSGELKADPRVKKASTEADLAPSEVITNTGPQAILRALKALNVEALKAAADADVKSGKVTRRDKAVKILQVLDGLQRTGVQPHQLMIRKVPVIPPQFRPYATMGESLIPGAANELYQDLMRHVDLHKRTVRTLGDSGAALTRRNMLSAVRAAYGYGDPVSPKLQGRGAKGFLQQILGDSPKFGFVQRRLLSKPIDSVGRGVITVNPDLDMNQISLPEDMAWELYGSHIQRRLVQRFGMSPGQAFKALADRTPEAMNALKLEMTPGVGRPVIYSRAPAWHKFNTVSGWPVLHKGTNIAINPYVTAGLNADFDGDQCINQLLACIPDSALPYWRMSYPKIDTHEVKMPANSKVPAVQGGKVFLFDLEDFPHGELQRSKEGANGRIDFHTVPLPIKVVAYDDKVNSLVWADVAFWSKHYTRAVEIVDTHNGYQLITDDDPRAVFGTAAGELSMRRFTPTEALNNGVLLPRVRHLPELEERMSSIDVVQMTDYRRAHRLPSTLELDADLGWLLGAMCGDGWVIQSKGDVSGFALADNDGFNIAKLRRLLMVKFDLKTAPAEVVMQSDEEGRHGSTVSYRFSSTNLGAWFREQLGGSRDENTSGSANKHLPVFYLSGPRAFREGLLCGLLDTDGSISVSGAKSKPQLMASMGSTSLRLSIETKLLAASLGIFSRITPSQTPKGKDFWQLTFSAPDVQKWNAPFMVHTIKTNALRSVAKIEDSAVTARFDIVPVSQKLADSLAKAVGCPKIRKEERKSSSDALTAKKAQQALYMSLAQCRNPKHAKYGAVSRQQAEETIKRLGEQLVGEMPDGLTWLRIVRDTATTWERVIGVQKTGIKEDGYDLTVPGYETFMSADGVILSNTINVNVPVLPESVEEAKSVLMPSNMKFSIRNQDQVMAGPKHEQVLGLYTASTRSSGKVHQFNTRSEAARAIEQGQVAFDDEVEFEHDK